MESNGTVGYSYTIADPPLPVEMTSFTAVAQKTSAQLKWSTAQKSITMALRSTAEPLQALHGQRLVLFQATEPVMSTQLYVCR